jgi:hypothetical protein
VSLVHSQSFANVPSADFDVYVVDEGTLQWRFWQLDNSSYVYKISLSGMWEIENTTNFDLVENSYYQPRDGWQINDAGKVNNSQMVTVTTDKAGPQKLFDNLKFSTQVPLSPVNGTEYPAGKFNVSISNYKWVSMSPSAQLVLAFTLDYEISQTTPQMPNLTTHGSRTVDFGGAYFSINTTAMGGPGLNESIDVALKMATSVNSSHVVDYYSRDVYVVYDHFESNLNHDPEFGFGSGPGPSYIWIIIIVVVVIAIIVIILIAVIGFILVRRRRRSYDAF